MEHRKSRLYRSLLSRVEYCKSILKSSLRDLPSLNKYQKSSSKEDQKSASPEELTRRIAFLIKELDKTFFELERRYKEEQKQSRKESESK